MISKRYNLINNIGGWAVFVIALVTYWLTLEPTASFWDCGEFIIQADKLEVGHPPGNPIFMLTARFFANFAPSAQYVSVMVNAMSGLLSALTILLLFWTISHLVRRLVVKDGQESPLSLTQYLVIMGSAAVGSLAYCWSDTFWFSAVEGEVYAFSSFCTALVFWLMLKWENRADSPHSDRYLVLIAYVIGISVAVHLLNLLTIPALVLIFVYRKFKDVNVKKSLLALAVSFVIVFLVLYGMVPGIMKVAQRFELLFVNSFRLPFNSGALVYTVVLCLSFAWALWELWRQKSAGLIRWSYLLAVAFSGVLYITDYWWVCLLLLAVFAAVLWGVFRKGLPIRVMNVVMWSMAMIFVGYSSYALILIRASADTPMNQNSPDNVFDLASYLNREQYGKVPLFYGPTLNSNCQYQVVYERDPENPDMTLRKYERRLKEAGATKYVKAVPGAQPPVSESFALTASEKASNQAIAAGGHRDAYFVKGREMEPVYNPELNMVFPRIHEPGKESYYEQWYDPDDYEMVTIGVAGETDPSVGYAAKKPSMGQNLSYFLNYQVNHMYMRYFMWNFAGRQNDLLNMNAEYNTGNWISGIPALDNARLGDQSLLPDEYGKGNKGHNVYYMLPLILGLLGLLGQAFAGRRGIEQFWVVFFLFFMTGIAIVLYLNQGPFQPRERDYAFAGSFYAFAIWIGMGVMTLWQIGVRLGVRGSKQIAKTSNFDTQVEHIVNEPAEWGRTSRICAIVACVLGIIVPLQMVSQTWDDHDRSGRYAARDFAIDYLQGLEPNAIVFCNGDNDTFPLWYAQEVEGVRPDVRIINLSYLSSDWYACQQMMQAYDSAPVPMTATPAVLAYDNLQVLRIKPNTGFEPRPLLQVLKEIYAGKTGMDSEYNIPNFPDPVYIPVDRELVVRRGLVEPRDTALVVDRMEIALCLNTYGDPSRQTISQSEMLMLDIVATNAARGWERPIYICSTVGEEFYTSLMPYVRTTGMVKQVVPVFDAGARTEKAYTNFMNFRWGGADVAPGKKVPYFDETAARMLNSIRYSILDTSEQLITEGDDCAPGSKDARAQYRKAADLLTLFETKMSERVVPLNATMLESLATQWIKLGDKERLGNADMTAKGLAYYVRTLDMMIGKMRYFGMLFARTQMPSVSYDLQLYYPVYRRVAQARYPYYNLDLMGQFAFYEKYQDYLDLDGNPEPVKQALARRGYSLKSIENAYFAFLDDMERHMSQGSGESYEDAELDPQEVYEMIVDVARFQSLAPGDYYQLSDDEKLYDSLFYRVSLLENVAAILRTAPDSLPRVDMERSRRLWEEYSANHPEAAAAFDNN